MTEVTHFEQRDSSLSTETSVIIINIENILLELCILGFWRVRTYRF